MKNLIIRALSGFIYVALIVSAIIFIKSTTVFFLLVFGLFTLIGMWEIDRLTVDNKAKAPLLSLIDAIGGVGVFLAFFLMYVGTESRTIWMMPILIYGVIRVIAQLYLPHVNPIHSLAHSVLSIAYVAIPLGLLNTVVAFVHPMMLLAIFIFLWINDSGAYLVGSAIGKRRLFERISPKKSWEGFWGGLAASAAGAAVMSLFFNDIFNGPQELWQWIGLALVVSVFGTFGDLTESLMKRTAGVKDSSNLIPGHGGILDRIDSLLLAVPASLVYFMIIRYFI